MHIDAVELFHLALPLRRPMPTPLGPRDRLETVLAAVRSGDVTGWGEAAPGNAPTAGGQWAAGAMAVLRDWFAPAVVGGDFGSGEELTRRLGEFRGNTFAKAALDAAWWDLDAQQKNCPLHRLLAGGKGDTPHLCEAPKGPSRQMGSVPFSSDAINVAPTFDRMESIDDLLSAIAQAVEAGFDRVKLKFRPGWDVQMVDIVRKEFPLIAIHIDCEGGLKLGQTDMLYRLEDFFLSMIEQPLAADDLVGHAMIGQSLRTPIALDEGIASIAQAEMALELESCKYVNLKPGRVGGLTPAAAIHDLCHVAGVPCWVGAAPQSTVGARAGFALAAKENFTYPSDFFPSDRVLAEDVAEPILPARDVDGRQRVRLWTGPGIGVEPRRELLEKFCLAKWVVDSG